jgi:hypothetical protein
MESDKKKVSLRQTWSYCVQMTVDITKKKSYLKIHIGKNTSGIPLNFHSYTVHTPNITRISSTVT